MCRCFVKCFVVGCLGRSRWTLRCWLPRAFSLNSSLLAASYVLVEFFVVGCLVRPRWILRCWLLRTSSLNSSLLAASYVLVEFFAVGCLGRPVNGWFVSHSLLIWCCRFLLFLRLSTSNGELIVCIVYVFHCTFISRCRERIFELTIDLYSHLEFALWSHLNFATPIDFILALRFVLQRSLHFTCLPYPARRTMMGCELAYRAEAYVWWVWWYAVHAKLIGCTFRLLRWMKKLWSVLWQSVWFIQTYYVHENGGLWSLWPFVYIWCFPCIYTTSDSTAARGEGTLKVQ